MNQAESGEGQFGFDLDALPGWAREVVLGEKPLIRDEAPAVAELAGGSSWPTLVSAAIVSSFLPRELVEDSGLDESHRREAEKNVMTFAEAVHVPDGTKWALTQDARRSVLSIASKQDIEDALTRTKSRFLDPISVALREQLSATQVDTESTSLPMLEAACVAASWLSESKRTPLVDVEDLNRGIALRRLLKPFRRMVGAEDSEGSQVDPAKIRFFGREKELTQLRHYVGVLPAAGVLGGLARLATRVEQAVLGVKPLIICWIGGVGKTALISQFALVHAEAA